MNCTDVSFPVRYTRMDGFYNWIIDNTQDADYCQAPHFNQDESSQTQANCNIQEQTRETPIITPYYDERNDTTSTLHIKSQSISQTTSQQITTLGDISSTSSNKRSTYTSTIYLFIYLFFI